MKHYLAADSDASRPAKASKIDPSSLISASVMSATHVLAQTLRLGIFKFLTTRDAVMVLSCCNAYWNDAELAKSVLLEGPVGEFTSHWFHDWPGLVQPQPDAVTAQLVSLIGAFEELILPTYPVYDRYISQCEDSVHAVPVSISLWDQHPKRRSLKPGHVWTREDVRVALNEVDNDLGDRFVDNNRAKSHPSLLGAHWENIKMAKEDGRPVCGLCVKRDFRSDPRDVVEHMDECFEFSEDVFDEEDRYQVVDAFCSTFAQPLKHSLLKYFKFVNRIKYDADSREEPWFYCCPVGVELIAGVSASGFLCGLICILDETRESLRQVALGN